MDNEPDVEFEGCTSCIFEADCSDVEYDDDGIWRDGVWYCGICGAVT